MILITRILCIACYFWLAMNNIGDCLSCTSFPESSFSCLTNEMVTKSIISNTISFSFKKGQEIYLEGSPSKGVYCVQKGKIKIFKKCLDRNLTLTLAGDSDLIGFHSIFTHDKYTNSACCLEDSQLCFIPSRDFRTILKDNPNLMLRLIELSSIENQMLSDVIRNLKCKKTKSRIAAALYKIMDKFGLDEKGCLNVTMTRKEISELSGTTTESAIRILNQMKREKIISFIDNRIKVADIKRLNETIKA